MSGFLATFQVPEQQILDQEQGPDPGLSRKALSSSGGTKKGKIIVAFFRIDVLSAGVVSSRKWDFFTNSERSHGGKNPEE